MTICFTCVCVCVCVCVAQLLPTTEEDSPQEPRQRYDSGFTSPTVETSPISPITVQNQSQATGSTVGHIDKNSPKHHNHHN